MIGFAITALLLAVAPGGDEVSFNRDILPILSNNCFACHGPDAAVRKAELRLDEREHALSVITPGDPDSSELMRRLLASRAREQMPPAETGKKLTDHEIELIRMWIKAGATWEDHWSFVAPVRAVRPAVNSPEWCRNPIDEFVLARLEKEGVEPSSEAARRTLIRRVTLDLTGLPPSVEEVEAFLADTSIEAYDRVVERLLASPHFGEHAARPWLDLARYADSQGYEKDNLRTMWRYRDWVINAFNKDMPFDQFTREQIAGDLLAEPTASQRIATGFHRNTQTNTEGGTDNEEFRAAAVIDRVNTTMQGWMGLTAGCAQCHDHKYDPLSQQEYYEFYAFFNQTKDNDSDNDQPFMKAPEETAIKRLAELEVQRVALEEGFRSPNVALRASIESWLDNQALSEEWIVLRPTTAQTASEATLEVLDDGVVLAGGASPNVDVYTLTFEDLPERVTAIKLEAIEGEDGAGPGRTGHGNFVVNELEFRRGDEETPIPFVRAEATHNQQDFTISGAIDGKDEGNLGWAVAPLYAQSHEALLVFGQAVEIPQGQGTLTLKQSHGTQHTLARFRVSASVQPEPQLPLQGEVKAAAGTNASDRTADEWSTLANAVLEGSGPLASIKKEQMQLQGASPTALVMEELPVANRRSTYLFNGGTFLAPDSERGELFPGVPDVLHELTTEQPTRLDLAEWLVAPNNPLTARVQVNRVWERLFGHGLVETVDDFGIQGSRPSHPKLLDWLARTWQDELAWSHKELLRLIVSSATYRQSSVVTANMLSRDPGNRLLSRSSRLRLSAEALRDTVLAASGSLVTDRIGGPSVVPRLPDGMLPQAFTTFVQPESSGDDLYRRGLYTQWRRTGHYPTFATFDAPSREFCLVARERSNTPLQALVMLNDEVFFEAAQGLARRVLAADKEGIDDRISLAFQLALARLPSLDELQTLRAVYDAAFKSAADDLEGATALATEPIGPLPEGMRADIASSMTVVSNVILNLDEFVNRP